MSIFRTRASSLLQSPPFKHRSVSFGEQDSGLSDPKSPHALSLSNGVEGGLKAISNSAQGHAASPSTSNTTASNQESTVPPPSSVRVLPPWVQPGHEYDDDDERDGIDCSTQLLAPPEAQVAQHNSSPAIKQKQGTDVPGRRYDAQGDWIIPHTPKPLHEIGSRWRAFADASAYPRTAAGKSQVVSEEWLKDNGPDYSQPWAPNQDDLEKAQAARNTRRGWWNSIQRTLIRNPMAPLVLRTIVWTFSLIGLALAASILHAYHAIDRHGSYASPLMAIIVDTVALVYLVWITWDEYTGKPLGLRSPGSKMRLVFLDLFFIVFQSANLSLAFETVGDNIQTSAEELPTQTALASVILIALIAWLMTFSISVLRLVERVAG